MVREYLITSNPFNGNIESFVDDGIVQHSGDEIRTETVSENGIRNIEYSYENGLTPQQYAEKHKLKYYKVVDSDEMDRLMKEHDETYLTDWEEIDEDTYIFHLEVLPPLRYNGGYFFVREAITANIHTCCIIHNRKFYRSNRRLNESESSIYNSVKNL